MRVMNTKPFTKLLIILLLTVVILVAKAYVILPFPQRFIEGHNVYQSLNAWQFKETAYFTFFIILWFCRSRLHLFWRWSVLAAFAASFINLSLMMIDARSQTFYIDIEKAITHDYGSPTQIYIKAIICLMLGLIMLGFIWYKKGFSQIDLAKTRWKNWQKNIVWIAVLLVVLVGLMNLQPPY